MSEPKIKYEMKMCRCCGEETSHVEVDTIEGKAWQCEICSTFWDDENE